MKRLLAISLLLLAAAPASAQEIGLGKATSATAALTSHAPGSASDLYLRVTGEPPVAPVMLAPALRQVVELPKGSKLRLASLPQCPAADAATFTCSADTQVGDALAVGVRGGQEIRLPLAVYNTPGALVFSATALKQSFRAAIVGRRLAFTVPTLDGTLQPQLFTATLRKIVKTPASCPKGRRWTATTTFQALTSPTGSLVGPVQSLASASRCQPR
jgi:hypothetical protein